MARLPARHRPRVADDAGHRPVLRVRVGAASVGLARHRSVRRARQGARARPAVPHHRRAVGLHLLPRDLLPLFRRAVTWAPVTGQVFINALDAVPAVHRLARPAVGQRIAALAAWITAIFSFNTIYASTQTSDAICTVLFLLSLLCFVHGHRRSSLRGVRRRRRAVGPRAAVPAEHDPAAGAGDRRRMRCGRRAASGG